MLRITTLALWAAAFVTTLAGSWRYYHLFAALTAFSAALLIYAAKDTQGHYRNISLAYMVGSAVWGFEELLRFIATFMNDPETVLTVAQNVSFIPLLFFSGGLLLMTQSEYNKLHFERMTLHTFAIAFFAFMVVQKLVLYHYAGMQIRGFRMFAAMVYFFVAVFTIVLIFSIFVQTNFRGHTFGTNCSAVMLTAYCVVELDRLYRILSDADPRPLVVEIIGLAGLVVYSWAQSDPHLVERGTEEDELKPGEQVKSLYIWGNSAVFLLLGMILYGLHFFDTRDLYLLIIAVLSYATIYKSLQARVYNTQLLEHQMQVNQRLEEMVEEKTRELRLANEELRVISSTDALTGLYNRRYGRECIQGLADAADRKPFAVMLMDLNHFKQVNDTYGHEIGDRVLEVVGRRLKSLGNDGVTTFRTAERGVTAIRLGGDEFVIVLEEHEGEPVRESAKKLAEEICRVMDEPIKTEEGDILSTACMGIGIWPENSDDIDELYQMTDEAMYDIKHKTDKSSYRFID